MSALRNAIKKVLIFLIKTYQLTLSPRFSKGGWDPVPPKKTKEDK